MNAVTQLLDLPPCPPERADAVVLPVPMERTVSYGPGTSGGPAAILAASGQVELFDEETGVDFEQAPRIHTAAALMPCDSLEVDLAAIEAVTGRFRDKFVLTLGGEHTLTLGAAAGLCEDIGNLTIVQIDAHADLIDCLEDGLKIGHGTVMRRLWERGARLVQLGVRSLSREEFELINAGPRIRTFFAHQLPDRFDEALDTLSRLEGDVYLSVDIDGLDSGLVPSTGTPQPDGLSWRQTMAILRAVTAAPRARLVGADLVEFVPSPHPPGCDLTAAKLAVKILAWWHVGQQKLSPSSAPQCP
ncbi:MAG: agmatinase family protein [Thermoguttaceae bacterium]|jgi:agmatinase|nr:agmatinase family protein [Thermoguttaceae bacterium]